MNVLVLGSGGREHAIGLALSQSASVDRVFALPGNPGMEPAIKTLPDGGINAENCLKACQQNQIDLVVIGPEDPLVAGLADQLRSEGLLVFGPDQRGSALEGSKIFSKHFMEKYKLPTAAYTVVDSVESTMAKHSDFTPPYVLKADGLAAGKGVFICKTAAELEKAAGLIFDQKILGEAGSQALLEQFQPGYELSFFVLTNGEAYVTLPMAQDHKKLLDNDDGPNTGGMGTVAPMEISKELYQSIIETVVEPTVRGLGAEKFVYRGVVFIGLMITSEGPQVLEYNVRFGDPETQVLLPLLDGDWGEAFKAIAEGKIPKLQWLNRSTACVVLAAENYPENPVRGAVIQGNLEGQDNNYFLHAGTARQGDTWVTKGGRVMNAVGIGQSLDEAIKNAYERAGKVSWPGLQKRNDIGMKARALGEKS